MLSAIGANGLAAERRARLARGREGGEKQQDGEGRSHERHLEAIEGTGHHRVQEAERRGGARARGPRDQVGRHRKRLDEDPDSLAGRPLESRRGSRDDAA